MAGKEKNKAVCVSESDQEEVEISSGLSLERLNLRSTATTPKKKLLVLSLGGLLCHRVYRYKKCDIPKFRHPDARYGSYLVYKRPYCEEFLKFCLQKFEVGIWSSAREWYLNNALDCITKGLRSKLLFAWDQDQCTDSGFKTLEKKDKPIFLKELNKIWKIRKQYSSSNTLLIDDEPYKALLNPPFTAIFTSEYSVDQVNDAALGPNGEIRLYLDGLADADDVTSYVKDHPYGQPAITPAHSDWEYYAKIISHFQKQ
ncbi:NLI interacting factor-like phosphatase [Quillaja saponaria]|uniref:Mitochondrial import inner membrane translocase subunit TIM50 n=1 Tax=Quillaja saponaria TaxID=32244 RepID=A0AAD7VHM2_QUISA|nr:NLI interacting factor-like phosphatase [Quillaja saponaria]